MKSPNRWISCGEYADIASAIRSVYGPKKAVAADGAEGRMVTILDGDGLGDHWERHPAGDELVVCLSGSVTVTRDVDGVPDRVVLGPGEATVNPAGAWHAVDMAGPSSIRAQASQAYSRMIAEVATADDATCLPLHERRIEELRRADPPPVPYRELTPMAGVGVLVRHAVPRRSLDTVSRRRGLVLTTGHIHQNSRGTALVAEVIDTCLPTRSA
ncbi:cupin domain-containing protein [Streptomyces sp. NPDC006261]|uniref:cupin domain-containing protein n=1 Tax=Streptomyces sp. NPDC006261 TaxID=3156739 RepID=UPI0033B88661